MFYEYSPQLYIEVQRGKDLIYARNAIEFSTLVPQNKKKSK